MRTFLGPIAPSRNPRSRARASRHGDEAPVGRVLVLRGRPLGQRPVLRGRGHALYLNERSQGDATTLCNRAPPKPCRALRLVPPLSVEEAQVASDGFAAPTDSVRGDRGEHRLAQQIGWKQPLREDGVVEALRRET